MMQFNGTKHAAVHLSSSKLAAADRTQGLQQAECQTAEISTTNAADLFIMGRGSLSECNYGPANVCASRL